MQQIVLQEAYRPVPYEELAPMLTAEARSRIEPGREYGMVWYPRRKITRGDPDPARDYKRPQKSEPCPREEQAPIPVASSGIPRELVDAASRAIRDNRSVRSNGHRVYELAGIVRCAGCGNLMSTNRKFWNGKPYHYYRCTRYMRDGLKGCEMNRGLRAEKLRALEEGRDRAVRQIRRGEWAKLGITAPEARQGRYREIGLEAKAASDATILLSWGLGEETLLRANGDTGRG